MYLFVCAYVCPYTGAYEQNIQLVNSCRLVRSGFVADSDEAAAPVRPSPAEFVEQHAPSPDLPTSAAAEDVTL